MFRVVECLWQEHDHAVVLFASSIWILGSAAFFLLLKRSRESARERRRHWQAIAGVAAGTGVWATHFVAMLGYNGAMPLAFAPGLTALSAAVAIVAFWLAASLVREASHPVAGIAAGLLATAGVAAMHFMGTLAIESVAAFFFDWPPIIVGGVVAFALFALAFVLYQRSRGWTQVLVPAACAILAVVILHFTAMSATTLLPEPEAMGHPLPMSRSWLIGAIVCASVLLIVLTAIAAAVDRTMADLRGLADAALEGLAIVRDGKVLDANPQTARLLGVEPRVLIGSPLDHWLCPVDGQPVDAVRKAPVEATLTTAGVGHRILEIASHAFEYRGRDCRVVAVRDLTETRDALKRIEHLALHDLLTGLPNRVYFEERLAEALAGAQRSGESFAVLALDLDRFKAVNDIFGHAAGDKVLRQVADLLRSTLGPKDTVARIGGDEFMILQMDTAQPEGARQLSHRLMSAFAAAMDVSVNPQAVGVSIGVAVCPKDAVDAATLRQGADVALYRSKSSGRGSVSFFDSDMDLAVRERRALEHDLRHALWRQQISVVYQPLVTTAAGQVTGYEALMRWHHPERGSVPPDVFIPIAEETGCILQLGKWILTEACRSAADWPDGLTVAVNVSGVQLQLGDLDDTVGRILAEVGCPAARLELEITESVLMKDRDATIATLRKLKARGVRIAMDDFGTGYSSLSNLQSFQFDKIKIDRSFTASILDDEAARTIVRAIAGIGRSLSMPVVAEGVETELQRQMVLAEGCSEAQGFLFGEPDRLPWQAQPMPGAAKPPTIDASAHPQVSMPEPGQELTRSERYEPAGA